MPAAAEHFPVILASLDAGIFPLQSCRESSTPLCLTHFSPSEVKTEAGKVSVNLNITALLSPIGLWNFLRLGWLEVQVHLSSPLFPLSSPLLPTSTSPVWSSSLLACPSALLRQLLVVHPCLARTPEVSLLTRAVARSGVSLPRHLAPGTQTPVYFWFLLLLHPGVRSNFLSPVSSSTAVGSYLLVTALFERAPGGCLAAVPPKATFDAMSPQLVLGLAWAVPFILGKERIFK